VKPIPAALFAAALLAGQAEAAALLELPRVGRVELGAEPGQAEVVAFVDSCGLAAVLDPAGRAVHFVDLDDPAAPHVAATVDLSEAGPTPTGIAAFGRFTAVTIAAAAGQPGTLLVLDCQGTIVARSPVGYHPDAVAFSPNGRRIVTADEGELAGDVDPPGGATILDFEPRTGTLGFAQVLTFREFDPNGSRAAELPSKLRLRPGVPPSLDLEPENVAISPNSSIAWLTLQESSGIAEIDLDTGSVRRIVALPTISFTAGGIDPSDRDGRLAVEPHPIEGLIQPDGIAVYEGSGGRLRLLIAGEGDTRGSIDEVPLGEMGLDPETFPNRAELERPENFGRLRVDRIWGDPDQDGRLERIVAFGSRAVHVLDAETLEPVWDSGSGIERLTHAHPERAAADPDLRSAARGPEPEGVAIAEVGGRIYGFVGLERAGGVAVIDLSLEPPELLGWAPFESDDISPEGLVVVTTPQTRPVLVASHEISSSLAIHDLASLAAPSELVVAAFNVQELSTEKLNGADPESQIDAAVAIIRAVRPDVLLLNEVDAVGEATALFAERLADPSTTSALGPPMLFPHAITPGSNTGVDSGLDLDRDGALGGPGDAWGFGRYPGQYGMAVLSRFPFGALRTFRNLPWANLPGALIPDGGEGRPPWYNAAAASLQPLSSKNHIAVEIDLPGARPLVLVGAHPTPPVFDGPEDRNGRRNYDEIRLIAAMLGAEGAPTWLVDDDGRLGPIPADAHVVVAGDLNADPVRDEAPYGRTAISQLLELQRLCDPRPRGPGGADFDRPYPGDPTERTNSWGRLDYVLPSCGLEVIDSRVFAPPASDPMAATARRASDHRLVWVRVRLPRP
jgi:endonuclease/exonuclease/phosphatase family metal-dependent hydrolase